jgi:ABC-type phosphate transport system auxiliary subunit
MIKCFGERLTEEIVKGWGSASQQTTLESFVANLKERIENACTEGKCKEFGQLFLTNQKIIRDLNEINTNWENSLQELDQIIKNNKVEKERLESKTLELTNTLNSRVIERVVHNEREIENAEAFVRENLEEFERIRKELKYWQTLYFDKSPKILSILKDLGWDE